MYIENEIIVSEMKQCIAKAKEMQRQIGALEVYHFELTFNKI